MKEENLFGHSYNRSGSIDTEFRASYFSNEFEAAVSPEDYTTPICHKTTHSVHVINATPMQFTLECSQDLHLDPSCHEK